MTVHDLTGRRAASADPARQGFLILHIAFVVLPITMGLDKFLHFLGTWPPYFAPEVAEALPFSAATQVKVLGLVEMGLGVLVALSARIGAYVLALWFAFLVLNAGLSGEHLTVAIRDLGLLFGALALARGAARYSRV